MKSKIICLFLFYSFFSLAQNGFEFESNINKVSIPFKFINNLIIIPIEVNGVSLNFLLDTGVQESILFSLDETEEVNFAQIEKIKIKGFGKKEAFDGYKSILNRVGVKDYIDKNHTLYLVLDQDINISSHIGVPVNGIIGYHFFKNNLIKIDYERNRITIYQNKEKQLQKLNKSFSKIPLTFNEGKPYLTSYINFPDTTSDKLPAKLLIDTGNSDAIWLFKEMNENIKVPEVNFEDYLGRGFSGDVFGNRARIKSFEIGKFVLQNPLVAFPNENLNLEIEKNEDRLGSVGSEMMKRFTVFFDYKGEAVFLKKNNNFDDPFNFNMSGIEIQHQGLQWVQSAFEDNSAVANNLYDGNGEKVASNLRYKFELKPVYLIANVRKNSPADLAGLKKDDVIVKLNRKEGYYYSLQDINELFKSEEGKKIELIVDRKGLFITIKFELKNMI